MDEIKKSTVLGLRLNQTELAMIRAGAQRRRMRVAEWLRWLARRDEERSREELAASH